MQKIPNIGIMKIIQRNRFFLSDNNRVLVSEYYRNQCFTKKNNMGIENYKIIVEHLKKS